MQFFININPPTVTDQEHRIGKRKDGSVYIYRDQELRRAREELKAQLRKFAPAAPLRAPVRLVVKWCFPNGSHRSGTYKTTKPDTDNLNKMLKDVMTELHFWKDDAAVASEIIEKFWNDVPGIFIRAEEIQEEKK